MADPICCGEPMEVVEYDSDEDVYHYVCQVNRDHTQWFTDEDEVWK